MQKYRVGGHLGDGAFGSVSKAISEQTGRVVAIKKMKRKYPNWQQCVNLNQVRILSKLHHPNIVRLLQLVKKNNQLYFVFQYLSRNVYQMLQQRGRLPHRQVRNIAFQTLQALAYIHRKGFFHRDMKPQNMLQMNGTIKLADFGLAREIRAKPPFTEYVSTRWYRAPQCLLRGRNYNSPMDVFAVGAIIAQLYTGMPLFPGSSQKDQLVKILQLLGTPSNSEWPQGYKLAAQLSFEMPQFQAGSLEQAIHGAPPSAISLLHCMLQVSPQKRMTAQQALQHEYFAVNSEGQEGWRSEGELQRQSSEHSTFKGVRYRPGYKCKL